MRGVANFVACQRDESDGTKIFSFWIASEQVAAALKTIDANGDARRNIAFHASAYAFASLSRGNARWVSHDPADSERQANPPRRLRRQQPVFALHQQDARL